MKSPFLLGDWLVSPDTNSIASGELKQRIEPRLMDVLIALVERRHEVVSAEELLAICWGSTLYGDGPVHKTIAQLRRMLGDSATSPRYIATIRKRGYQLIAEPGLVYKKPTTSESWPGSPFRGLQAFDEQDAAIFFGRSDAIQSLLQAVRERIDQGLALQVVLGPSGSGKTSLVCAGLVPALAKIDAPDAPILLDTARLDLRDTANQSLMNALGATLLDWEIDGCCAFPGASGAGLGGRLTSEPEQFISELKTIVQARRQGERAPMFTLFIDSYEALLNSGDADEVQHHAFLKVLEFLARSGAVLVLLACRNDYYPRLAATALIKSCKQKGGQFDLEPPSRGEIAQIISMPALAAGLRFEQDPETLEGLDLLLASSAANNPDALPLLQYMLEELYRLRTDDGLLSVNAFHQLGGLEAAIGQRAEQVIQAMTEAERASLPYLFSLLVVLSDDEQISSRRAAWSDLRTDSERALVQALVEARLFVSALLGQQPGFGVAHEAVLRRWPRVLDWIASHRMSLRVHAHLTRQANRWEQEGRPAYLLLSGGKMLSDANNLAPQFPLSMQELALIQSSNRRATRGARLRLGILTLLLALATLAAAAGLLAVRANGLAQQRRAEVEGLVSFMLGDFADKLRPLARLDLLDTVSAKAMTYLSDASADAATPASLAQQAQALQVIAEVRIARGDSRAAELALHTARSILDRQIAQNPADRQLWKKRGTNAFWLGKIRMEQSHWDDAQALFEQYRDDSEKLYAAEPDSIDGWIELSYALNTLGTLALKRGQSSQAMALFTRSVDLKSRALTRTPNDRALAAELADSLSWVASTKESSGQLREALPLYQREFDIVLRIHETNSGEPLWQNRMSIALQHQANVKLIRGDSASALRDWQYAESLLNTILEQEPGNRVWQRNRAMVRLEQQRVFAYQQAPAQTLARLQAIGHDIDELLRLEPKKVEWIRMQAVTQQRSAAMLLRLQSHRNAQMALQASESALLKLLAGNRADARSRDALVQTLLSKAELHRALGDPSAARAACLQAERLLPPSSGQSEDFRLLDPWVRLQNCQGKSDGVIFAVNRLDQMGYSERAFQYFLLNHK